MKNVTEGNNTGITWELMEKLEDLDIADDIVQQVLNIQTKVTKLYHYARKKKLVSRGPKCWEQTANQVIMFLTGLYFDFQLLSPGYPRYAIRKRSTVKAEISYHSFVNEK